MTAPGLSLESILPDPMPIAALRGAFARTVRVPGSKSITNRALVLAAIARGETHLKRPLTSDDTDRLCAGIEALGARVRRPTEGLVVAGCAGAFPRGGTVDCGDGGTPARFMLALAALARGKVTVDGSARLRERPMADGFDLLRRLGVRVESAGGHLPATVFPRGIGEPLVGGTLEVGRTASSQFLSSLLLIGPCCRDGIELRYREPPTSATYLDLTVSVLTEFGLDVVESRDATGTLTSQRVAAGTVEGRAFEVEADASSAAYFALAAAIVPRSEVTLVGIPSASRQPDLRLLDALAAMGARVERDETAIRVRGPESLAPLEVDASGFPDAALALAAACACANGVSVISGLGTLAAKESDRIAALATELERIGCRCEATASTIRIDPGPRHREPVVIETYRDHRIAMTFAVLGLVRSGISIRDPGCVRKSYPGFWRTLAELAPSQRATRY